MPDDIRVISPEGRIDAATAPALESTLSEAIGEGGRRIVVDLSSVEYMSSAGLRVLLAAMKREKSLGGVLVLCSLNPFVKEVFDLTGFSRIFTMCSSREEAISLCGH